MNTLKKTAFLFPTRILLTVCLIILLHPAVVFCTPEYAAETGKSCRYCHIDPGGGGRLTAAGNAFADDLRISGRYRVLNPVQRVIRFIVGYFHTITAIVWFGTILYVHLILKPAYAAGGLPRGELMLGWASIAIMAVTGTLLSIARVPSWFMLFHTRFGILLTIKILLFLVMVSTAVIVTFVIGPKLKKKMQESRAEDAGGMTSAGLAYYDGKEGRQGYIAYGGAIYDVTASRLWRGGSHLKKHQAGVDLTDALKTAPHGEEKVLAMPMIGKLRTETETKKPLHIRIFYFFAYMNLVLVFLIVFIISLWRWW